MPPCPPSSGLLAFQILFTLSESLQAALRHEMRKYAAFQVISATLAPQQGQVNRERILRTGHRAVFEYDPKPGFLYVRSRAISSRCNDNYDEFPAEEIKLGYRSFIGKPVFVNHANDNHRRARGVIVDAALHEDRNPDGSPDTWTEVLMEVDAVKFPKLAQAILAGQIDRTSMGVDVKYSVCTYCGNQAATPLEYCAHIPRLKGKRIQRMTASGSKEDVLVAERCYGLAFFENSLLVEPPADPTAYFLGVDDRGLNATASRRDVGVLGQDPRRLRPSVDRDLHRVAARDPEYDQDDHGRYRRVTPSGNEIQDHVKRHGRQPATYRYECKECGQRLWGSGLGIGSHNRKHDRAGAKGEDVFGNKLPTYEELGRNIEDEIQRDAKLAWISDEKERCPRCTEYALRTREDGSKACEWCHYDTKTAKLAASKLAGRVDDILDELSDIRHQLNRMLSPRYNPSSLSPVSPDAQAQYRGLKRATDALMERQRVLEDELRETRPPDYDDVMEFGPDTYEWDTNQQAWVWKEGSARHLAYDEVVAPPEVDTMRESACPVCGEEDAYNGQDCGVCGFTKPPDMFMDPDTEVAKQQDLRQDRDDAAQAGSQISSPTGYVPPGGGQAQPGASQQNASGYVPPGIGYTPPKSAARQLTGVR